MGLSEPLLKALKDMEFDEPTEVQARAIPPVLNGKDVLVMSKTGSGKTAVFGMSVLQLTDPKAPGPQCLILEPTRELAVQVDNDLKRMAKYVPHSSTAVYGQHNMGIEIRDLGKNVTFVTGTPGRVYDHIQQKNLKTKNIKYLVLDEVDRMMDMGFIDQVRRIIRTLPRNRVTLLFSATIPPEIARLCEQFMKDPVSINIESETLTVDSIEQKYYRVERNEKRTQLNRILLMEQPETCMIFCNTKIAVDQVQSFLTRKGYAARALHGDIPQNKRMTNIQQFKKGTYHILVATDVAARGIHIEDLSLVINYDVPFEKDSYIHRIGRTGRAGHDGKAITFVTGEDIMSLYAIEEHIGAMIPEESLPTDEELTECKADADEWVKAHTLKGQPGKQATSQNKPSRKAPYQKAGAKRQNQGQRQNQQQDSSKQSAGAQTNASRQSQDKDTVKRTQQSTNRQTQQASSSENRSSSYNRNKGQSWDQRKPQVNEERKNAQAPRSEQRAKDANATSAVHNQNKDVKAAPAVPYQAKDVKATPAAQHQTKDTGATSAVQHQTKDAKTARATQTTQSQTQPSASPEKKSLLKRIIGRIVGK